MSDVFRNPHESRQQQQQDSNTMVMESATFATQRQDGGSCGALHPLSDLFSSPTRPTSRSSCSASSSVSRGSAAATVNLDFYNDEMSFTSKEDPHDCADGELSRLVPGDGSALHVSGGPPQASTPRVPRAFSVVPVDDLKSSPNSNLVQVKRRLLPYSKAYSDSDCDETETLLNNSLLDESKDDTTSPTRPSFKRRKSLVIFNTEAHDNNHIVATQAERRSKEVSGRCSASEVRQASSALTCHAGTTNVYSHVNMNLPQVLGRPDSNYEPSKEIKTPVTLMAPFRDFSSDPPAPKPKALSDSQPFLLTDRRTSNPATRFPRVELRQQNSMPMHYMTVNPGAGNLIYNSHSAQYSQYLTVQPTRSRGYPNQVVLDTIQRKFITSNCNGTSNIDFGSTDGRNIKLMRRALLSADNMQLLANGYTADGQCTIHSMKSISPEQATYNIGDTLCQMEVHSPVCTNNSTVFSEKQFEAEQKGDEDEDEEGDRPTWDSKVKFVLACVGSCVGLGNFWRFPYLCYKSGGGAFMLPYLTMLFLCGIPLLLMEMAIGQYTRLGPIGALNQLCPLFIGSAVGVVIISIIFCSYYNVIISWSIFYLAQSFRSVLPWTECSNSTLLASNTSGLDCVIPSNVSATQYYFDTQVLHKSEGIEDFGMPVLPLLGCLAAAWVIVYFSIWKSIKSSGMVVLVTATAPYLLILVFLVRAVTLDGAGDGLRFLFYPNWSRLLDIKVWVNAAAQNFNSIGIGFGSMITYSSYNKFSNNILMDVWLIALINAGTSLLAGIIVFSTMGNIAYEHGSNITDVVSEGPGLAFVVYPQALAKMPFPNFFSILFFAMLIILGIDSQFATVEVIVTSLKDAFPRWIETKLGRHEVLALLVCLFCLVLGLPNIFQGGIYFFYLLDYYSAAISLMYLAFFEVTAVVWCYGASTLCRNIREMTGKMPSSYFRLCWLVVSPFLITVIAIASWVDYQEPTYNQGTYTYPGWAIGLGWIIACLSIVPIPLGMIIQLWRAPGDTFLQKLKHVVKPQIETCLNCNKSSHNPEGPCRCIYQPPPNRENLPLNTLSDAPMIAASSADRGCINALSVGEFDSLHGGKGTLFSFT